MLNKQIHYQTSQSLVGAIAWAQFAPEPLEFASASKTTGARRQGVNYEKKAQDYILQILANKPAGLQYMRSPWLCYKTKNSERIQYCQPDGVFFGAGMSKATIIEIKLQHTAEAYYQVRRIYQPVLEFIHPTISFSALEICKWVDPHVKFPESYKFAEDVEYNDPVKFGVHIFNPGR